MKRVSVHAAKTQLSKLLSEVERGAEVVIMRRGEPVARLSRTKGKKLNRPRVGFATSAPIKCNDEVFAPLSDKELQDWGLK